MAFKGDASHIPVSNIVQALFMNGQEGVLTIDDGTQHRNIRVLKLGIRLLASSPSNPDILKYAILKEQILNEAEFQNVISTWDPKTLFPGDFLVRRRLISPEQVENEIRKQVEELVFDIFSTKDLRYEFKAGEEWIDHEIFNPEDLGASLIFNVNGVLMESVRREDDWGRIQEVIQSEHEILVSPNGALPETKPEKLDIADRTYHTLRQMLTGDKTIDRIVRESPLSRYEVHHALYLLQTRRLVRKLTLQEKEELAEKLRRMLKTREAIDLYQSILASEPHNLRIRMHLIEILERIKQRPELLVEHYLALVRHFERVDLDKALVYIDKVLQIDSHCLDAYESQFILHHQRDSKDAAMATARALVKVVKATGRHDEGARILTRLLRECPGEPYLLHEVVDLLLTSGHNDKAVAYLKSLAAIYDSRGDRPKLRKTCELIVKIDPSERSRIKKVLAEERKRRAGASRRTLKASVLAAFVGAIIAGLAYYVVTDNAARALFADVERDVDTFLKYNKLPEAEKTISEYERVFPFIFQKRGIRQLRERLKLAKAKRRDHETWKMDNVVFKALSVYGKANKELKKGNYRRALSLLTGTYGEISKFEDEIPPQHRGVIRKIKEQITKIENHFASAEKLYFEAREAEEKRDIKRAHELALEILRSYSNTPTARKTLVPVLIQSRPEGAAVLLDGKEIGGRTPLVVKLPAHKRSQVTIQRRGFLPVTFDLVAIESPGKLVHLKKAAEWAFQHKGPCEGRPLSDGPGVCFSNRNGQIYCLGIDGQQKWRFTVPNNSDLSGGLGLWNNLLYTGCYDGYVYVLNVGTGTKHGSPVLASPNFLPIKDAPSAASSEGIVVVNCGNRVLSGIELSSGTRVWMQAPANSYLLGEPQSDGRLVYAFTREGNLLRFDQRTGAPEPPIFLGGRITHPGTIVEGKAFFALDQNTVAALELSSRRLLWTAPTRTDATAPPTVSPDSHVVIVPLSRTKELLCLDSRTGTRRWQSRVGSSIETDGLVFRGKLYVGTRDGYIQLWDVATGELVWQLKTVGATLTPPRGVLSRGAISRGRFFQGSADGYLYCLTLD